MGNQAMFGLISAHSKLLSRIALARAMHDLSVPYCQSTYVCVSAKYLGN